MILRLRDVARHFKGLVAVDGVTLDVAPGELVGIIGRNGAGKTTLFNLIAGRLQPSGGRIEFAGADVTSLRAYQKARRGIARTFQVPEPLGRLNVLDNVKAGAFATTASAREATSIAEEVIELCNLRHKKNAEAAELTLADMKRLEVARALATRPKLLLLDEVMAGLRPTEVSAAMELCRAIRASGVTLLVIEHVMFAVMNMCERVVVIEQGGVLAEGTPGEILSNQQVVDVYLGRPKHV